MLLTQHYMRLAALAEIDLSAAGTDELSSILTRIAEVATQFLPSSGGASVILWDARTDDFILSATTMPTQPSTEFINSVRRQGGVTRWIIEHRQPHIAPDISVDSLTPNPMMAAYGLQAYVGVPLLYAEDVLGVLYALDRHPRQYSKFDLDFLQVLAKRAALVIHNRHVLDISRRLIHRQHLLLKTSQTIVASLDSQQILTNVHNSFKDIRQALPNESFTLLKMDDEAGVLRPFISEGSALPLDLQEFNVPLGQGIVGHVLRSGKAELINNAQLDPRAIYPPDMQIVREHLICVPMRLRGQTIGAVMVSRWAGPPFSHEDFELAQLLVNYILLALENAELYAQVERLAITDSLTELNNRRHFFKLAQSEWQRVQRYQYPLSILMMDVDHFKDFNDTYGHGAGDETLHMVAQACRANSRSHDILGRYGGEEFVMLLPHTDLAAAVEVAERLRLRIAQTDIPTPSGVAHVTISVGIATTVNTQTSLESLLHDADMALYEAKATGRNRIVSRQPT